MIKSLKVSISIVVLILNFACTTTANTSIDKVLVDTSLYVGDSSIMSMLKEVHTKLPSDNKLSIKDDDSVDLLTMPSGEKKFSVKDVNNNLKFEEVFNDEQLRVISETIKAGKKLRLISANESTKIAVENNKNIDIIVIVGNKNTTVTL